MSNDLVKRLRKGVMCGDDPIVDEAADRIEKLEAALREIADITKTRHHKIIADINLIARKALEGKE
jgi:hypothetical protein